jgi:hemerythrin-like domain-containing protein
MTTQRETVSSLRQDNALMERFVHALDKLIADAKQGGGVPPGAVHVAVDFIKVFIEQRHRTKEQKALFPLLAAKSEILANGPVRILADEDATDHELIAQIEAVLPGVEAGDPGAIADAIRDLEIYAFMLHNHVEKEDEIIFRLADALITEEEATTLHQQFDAIDRAMGPIVKTLYEDVVSEFEQLIFASPPAP